MTRHDGVGGGRPVDEDIVAGALPPRLDYMFAEPPGGGLDWGTSSRLGHSLADYTGLGVTVASSTTAST